MPLVSPRWPANKTTRLHRDVRRTGGIALARQRALVDAQNQEQEPACVNRWVLPRVSLGNLLANSGPFQTMASGFTSLATLTSSSMPRGANPPLFHTCVLPWWTSMCAWRLSSSSTATTRSGLQTTTMSSKKAKTFSLSRRRLWTASNAGC